MPGVGHRQVCEFSDGSEDFEQAFYAKSRKRMYGVCDSYSVE